MIRFFEIIQPEAQTRERWLLGALNWFAIDLAMLSAVSEAATVRFAEVRTLLNELARLESQAPNPDHDHVIIARALLYVQLYGAFEFAITRAVQTLLQLMSDVNVPYVHLAQNFYAVALDGRFHAVADCSPRNRWPVRRELLTLQKSLGGCGLNDTLFHRELQNIWFDTLVELFENIGLPDPVVPDSRYRGYIDEVVTKRNEVAHGRESPMIVGKIRCADFESRLDAVSKTTFHVISCFEGFLISRQFVDATHRALYPHAPPPP